MTEDYKNENNTSVIIPCFNCSKTINRTLQSLDNQTNRNFEVIIINDGSTDNTHEIVERWIKKTKCSVKYLKTSNSGVSSARNKALSIASGKYILFLDSDDVFHSQFVELLVNQMENEDIDTAYCSYTNDLKQLENNNIQIEEFEPLTNDTLMHYYLTNKIPCGMWSFIYKRKIIEEYGLHFTEGVKYGEDTEFVWKYLSLCKKAVTSKAKLYGYFVTEDSATKKVSADRMSSLEAISRVEEFMKVYNIPFLFKFKEFVYSRTLISLFKVFAESGQLELFSMLLKEDNLKRKILKLAKFPDLRIRISSLVFLINPYIFYYLIRLTNKVKRI